MQIQYVILKVRLLSNKIPGKKIDFSFKVHKTEISQMDLLSTMRQCVDIKCIKININGKNHCNFTLHIMPSRVGI